MIWDDVLRLAAELPPSAEPELVRELLEHAWLERAPKRVVARFLEERGRDAGT